MTSKSSRRWLDEHARDQYVTKAQKLGYRSRACFKLIELNEKNNLIKPASKVIDLGAAPGGWSQVAAELVGKKGRVVASDILEIDAISDVQFIQGDFTEQECYDEIINAIDNSRFDLVLSDMAPNMSGIRAVDQAKSMYLAELALDMACQTLTPGGSFVTKLFHGEGFDAYVKAVKARFTQVNSRKPDASRPRSREIYLVAKGFRG